MQLQLEEIELLQKMLTEQVLQLQCLLGLVCWGDSATTKAPVTWLSARGQRKQAMAAVVQPRQVPLLLIPCWNPVTDGFVVLLCQGQAPVMPLGEGQWVERPMQEAKA